MILSLRGDLTLFMLRNIYFTEFQSLIRYGTVLWGGKERVLKYCKYKKVFFIQLKGCVKERLVDQFLKC